MDTDFILAVIPLISLVIVIAVSIAIRCLFMRGSPIVVADTKRVKYATSRV